MYPGVLRRREMTLEVIFIISLAEGHRSRRFFDVDLEAVLEKPLEEHASEEERETVWWVGRQKVADADVVVGEDRLQGVVVR